jgi:CubicO group peptidase (beta-lactamase class C family)
MKNWRVPGCAIGIVEKGRVIHAEAFGVRDLTTRLPIEPGTLFGIASCTKAFTATALGILVDEGKLEWDKPVRDYMPWFAMHDPVATERVTPRDLLSHRSGLPRHDMVWFNTAASRRDLCARIRHLPLSKDFRSLYQYNNLLYMVAGMLVEEVSGKTWEEFVTTRLFEPLGMNASGFVVANMESDPRYAVGHDSWKGKIIPYTQGWLEKVGVRNSMAPCEPCGGIVSNVPDMCRWICFNLGAAGKSIVSKETLATIHAPVSVVPDDRLAQTLTGANYALGWGVVPYRERRIVWHSGYYMGFISRTALMPGESLGVVVLGNGGLNSFTDSMALNAFDRLLGLEPLPWSVRRKRAVKEMEAKAKKEKSIVKRVRGTRLSHALRDYAAAYEHPGYGTVQVRLEAKALTLNYRQAPFRLRHYHYDVFEAVEIVQGRGKGKFLISFGADRAGKIASLAIRFEPTVDDTVFLRTKNTNE